MSFGVIRGLRVALKLQWPDWFHHSLHCQAMPKNVGWKGFLKLCACIAGDSGRDLESELDVGIKPSGLIWALRASLFTFGIFGPLQFSFHCSVHACVNSGNVHNGFRSCGACKRFCQAPWPQRRKLCPFGYSFPNLGGVCRVPTAVSNAY